MQPFSLIISRLFSPLLTSKIIIRHSESLQKNPELFAFRKILPYRYGLITLGSFAKAQDDITKELSHFMRQLLSLRQIDYLLSFKTTEV